jgi:GH15 family glucan-1,4-alpha-glucosidase
MTAGAGRNLALGVVGNCAFNALEAIRGELKRYTSADDFGVPNMAFSACTFWCIDALVRNGAIEEARELFDGLIESCNPLGPLSEDIDPATGELWGNFPQTYSMVGIIDGATRLSRRRDTML